MSRAHNRELRPHFAAEGPRKPRIALYSHDAMGLGHLRRNLLIAQALAGSELATTNLMITGAYETNFFNLPDGVDCLTLPRISKDPCGDYHSAKLDISADELTDLRQASICSALNRFQPDVFIVDKVPRGACGELMPALKALKKHGNTRCILGLRDILDDSKTVRTEWLLPKNVRVLERYYDAIWIYGDPHVYDAVEEYGFPGSIAEKSRFSGYLNQSLRLRHGNANDPCECNGSTHTGNADAPRRNKQVVCVVGGGQDGAKLIETFMEAITPDIDGIVLTGPYLPQAVVQAARQSAARRTNVQVLDFAPEADRLIAGADCVVGMAGYNTVCSILSFSRPALLVPRVTPRREQWIRAERLAQLGVVDVITPDRLTPSILAAWLQHPMERCIGAEDCVDLNGLDRIVEWVAELLPKVESRLKIAPPAPASLAKLKSSARPYENAP